ncbi:unnamed protein product [Rhodiola kirilowii]
MATIDDLYKNGVDKVSGEAKGIGMALKKFNFIFCLLLMHEVMKITNFLSQAFQKKDMDILSMELLTLSASFHPRNGFQAFKAEDVCLLASKFYPYDFTSCDMYNLEMECGFFVGGIEQDSMFAKMTSISDLCRLLVESGKSIYFPMIYRLICLILTLPVSTATTERAFSSMKIIKSDLRNKLSDEFLDDLMVLYIERTFTDCISNDDVIAEFEMSGPRRVKFS